MNDTMALTDLLNHSFFAHDIDETLTVREYLSRLLVTLLDEGEGFSGKSPFGNSGWENFLLVPAVETGCLNAKIDISDPDYPEVVGYDRAAFAALQTTLVRHALGVSQ